MTRAILWVVPLVAVLGAAVAGGSGGEVVGAGVIGIVAATILWQVEDGRVRHYARQVNRLLGDDVEGGVEPRGGAAWRELGTAVNALARQFQGVRQQVRGAVPWAERLVASLDDPAFVFSPEGRMAAANDAGVELANLTEHADAPTVLQTLGSPGVVEAVDEARASGHLVAVREERAGRSLRITASPLDEDVLVVVSDRTHQRRVEEVRRDFVINASHELKTPVTAIQSLTDALQVAGPDRRPQLERRLVEESERLSRLVHDLLDLRRLEEPDAEELVPVDIVALVRAAVADCTAGAEERDVGFDLDLPARAVVAGRSRDLSLAVDNLVANAVQYNTDGGTVTVEVRRDDGTVELVVRDTGIGIPREAMGRVFERFYRVDVARSRETGGTGLGLSIVRNAVERHGGRVTVDSLVGDGTTFTVRLPVQPAS